MSGVPCLGCCDGCLCSSYCSLSCGKLCGIACESVLCLNELTLKLCDLVLKGLTAGIGVYCGYRVCWDGTCRSCRRCRCGGSSSSAAVSTVSCTGSSAGISLYTVRVLSCSNSSVYLLMTSYMPRYGTGLTGEPFRLISKCRCEPKLCPVLPTSAIFCP